MCVRTRRNKHADVIALSTDLPYIAFGHATFTDYRWPRIVCSPYFATFRKQLGFFGNWDPRITSNIKSCRGSRGLLYSFCSLDIVGLVHSICFVQRKTSVWLCTIIMLYLTELSVIFNIRDLDYGRR